MCTAPGMRRRAPRTVVPQYSPSLRVSSSTLRRLTESRRGRRCQVAMISRRASLSTRSPRPPAPRARPENPRRPRAEPAVEQPHRRMAEMLEEPERAGGANARTDRRRRRSASSPDPAAREQVLDDPHERLQRRRVGVDQADAEQVEVDCAADVSRGVGIGRPQVDEQGTGPARLADGPRQFLGRDQQLGVRIPFHPGDRTTVANPSSLILNPWSPS